MWSALLKILELLMKAVNREATPDQRRRFLAKDLAKIYMDIDELVNRGAELLSLFEAGSLVVNDARIDILLAQQDALHSIRNHLQRLAPLFAIQLPSQASALHLLIEGKWEKIMFLLNWFLYDAPDEACAPLLDAQVPPAYLAKLLELGGVGKLAVPEQIGGFFKAGVIDQVGDLIAAVDEPAGDAIDETDVAGNRDNALKSP